MNLRETATDLWLPAPSPGRPSCEQADRQSCQCQHIVIRCGWEYPKRPTVLFGLGHDQTLPNSDLTTTKTQPTFATDGEGKGTVYMSKTRFGPLSSLVQVIHQDGCQFIVLAYTPDSTDLFHTSLHSSIATPHKSTNILFVEVGIVPNYEDGQRTNLWWFGVWTQQDLEAFFVGIVKLLLCYPGYLWSSP